MYGMADEPLLNLSLKNVAIKDALWEIETIKWFSCIMLTTWVRLVDLREIKVNGTGGFGHLFEGFRI